MKRVLINLTNDCNVNQLNHNIFLYVLLFVTIILSWNLLKYTLWYLLELSDPFFKNENCFANFNT